MKELEIAKFSNIKDFFAVFKTAFPKTTAGISAYVKAIKAADGVTGKFKASFTGLGAAMEANPVGMVIAGIVALIAVIKAADYFIDKANESTEELIDKKSNILDKLSKVEDELSTIESQIQDLNKQKLSITDPNDIEILETQIDLLEARKRILEGKKTIDAAENEQNAKDIIDSAQRKSVWSGAIYNDGYSGKLSKKTRFGQWLSDTFEGTSFSDKNKSAFDYVNTLEDRLSSIGYVFNKLSLDFKII